MIEFKTLGQLNLADSATGAPYDAILARSKRVALFSYLALARPRGFHRRSIITGIFWPDSPESKARRALNQAIYVLRTGLVDDIVVTRGLDEIGLDLDRVDCDAWAFERVLEAGDPMGAVVLYRGPLLNGFYLPDSIEFERWLDSQRTRYQQLAVNAALAAASSVETADQAAEVLETLRRLLSQSPYEEEVAIALVQLLARCGHRSSALKEFEIFTTRLEDELSLSPSRDLVDVGKAIRGPGGDTETSDFARAVATPSGPIEKDRMAQDLLAVPIPQIGSHESDGAADRPGPKPSGSASFLPAVVLILLLLSVAAVATTFSESPAPPTLVSSRVLVLPLENETGEPALDGMGAAAADWISSGLLQTGMLQVVSQADVSRWMRALGDEDDEAYGNAPAAHAELARRAGAGLLVAGFLRMVDDSLQLFARISDVESGTLARSLASRKVEVDESMAAAEDLRERVIGALATTVDPRFAAWTRAASQPPSFYAYQLYAEGKDLLVRDMPGPASRLFLQAADADTAFTSARIWAATAGMADWYAEGSTDSGRWARADSILREVEQRLDRLPAWDLAMTRFVRAQLDRDTPGALDAIRRVNEIAPDSEWLLNEAALATIMDRPSEALAVLSRIDPDWPWFKRQRGTYRMLRLRNLHRLGRYQEELDEVTQIRVADESEAVSRWAEFRALLGLGNRQVIREILEAYVLPNERLAGSAFMELKAHGYEDRAVEPIELAIASQYQIPESERDHRWRLRTARYLVLVERYDEALVLFSQFEPSSDGYFDALGGVGYIEAVRGNREEAVRILDAMADAPDRDFALYQRAGIAAALGEREQAVKFLKQMRIKGSLHPEVNLSRLVGYPPFEEWLLARG